MTHLPLGQVSAIRDALLKELVAANKETKGMEEKLQHVTSKLPGCYSTFLGLLCPRSRGGQLTARDRRKLRLVRELSLYLHSMVSRFPPRR